MRLSSAESGAIGSSGSASESTCSASSRSSRPPSLTRSSATTVPVTRDGRLGRQRRDRRVELARRLLLRQHRLREPAFVAQDHELHALLVAHARAPSRGPCTLLARRAPPARRSVFAPPPRHPTCTEASGRRTRPRRSSTSTANSSASTRLEPLDRAGLAQVARRRARARRRRSARVAHDTRATAARIGRRACGLRLAHLAQHVGGRPPARRSSRSAARAAVAGARALQLARVGPGRAVHRALLPPRPHLLADERQERREQPLEDRQRERAARG